MDTFILNNWVTILTSIVILGVMIFNFIKLVNKPNSQQIANLMEWLKYAVCEAESIYGGGTGELKLRSVYDAAVLKFPWIAKYITFEKFSQWVDLALEWMEKEIKENVKLKEAIINE